MRGKLGEGKYALVDDKHYDLLSRLSWHAKYNHSTYYAATYINTRRRNPDGRWRYYEVMMQNLIMPPHGNYLIDHRDGNGLNNQESNLRYANRTQNGANRRIASNNVSGYVGVHWCNTINKWVSRIRVRQKTINLGSYDDVTEAARVRDQAAIRYFGEFAKLNFPTDENSPSNVPA